VFFVERFFNVDLVVFNSLSLTFSGAHLFLEEVRVKSASEDEQVVSP
jgi:hypothetical protein